MNNRQTIFAFDLAKAVGITAIVIAHIDQLYKIREAFSASIFHSWIEQLSFVLGHYGVSLFLVASGFGMTWSLLHKTDISWKRWFYRRAIKIYPLFWISFAFFLIFFNAGYVLTEWMPSRILPPEEILLTLSGLQAFFGLWGGDLNAVYWFNSLIIGLSLLYPLLFLFSKKIDTRLLVLSVFLLSLISSFYAINQSYLFFRYLPLTRLFELTVGVALAVYLKKTHGVWPSHAAPIIGVAGALLLFFAHLVYQSELTSILLVIGTGPLLTLFFLSPYLSALPNILAAPIRFLAKHSHGIFLFHLPLLGLGHYIPNPDYFLLTGIYITIMIVSIGIAEKIALYIQRTCS